MTPYFTYVYWNSAKVEESGPDIDSGHRTNGNQGHAGCWGILGSLLGKSPCHSRACDATGVGFKHEFEIFRIFFSQDMGHENASHFELFFVFLFTAGEPNNLALGGWRAEYNSGDIPQLISEDTAITKTLMLRWSD